MPKKLDRCVKKLIDDGWAEDKAYAICNASIKDEGMVHLFDLEEDFIDAEYQGKEVTLNKPFRTPDESKKFAVYVKDGEDVKIVRFGDPDMEIQRDDFENRESFRARHKCDEKTDKTTPGYWSCRMWSSTPVKEILDHAISFKDKMTYADGKVVSVRDGVMEYAGAELGLEPKHKIFKVYRKPDTIRDVSKFLDSIPITKGHYDTEKELDEKDKHGFITHSKLIPIVDQATNSSLAVENGIKINGDVLQLFQDQELSLGYNARLVPHDTFDFEQIEIQPHHLAIVPKGRCGEICKFKDSKMITFFNEDGSINKDAIGEAMKALSEVLEKAEGEEKQSIMDAMNGVMPKPEEPKPTTDMDGAKGEEDKKEFGDAAAIAAEAVKEFKDSQCFKDALHQYGDERLAVCEKASKFLDESYKFEGKTNLEIMADTLKAVKPSEKFTDNEIPVAFKMVEKQTSNYQNFGDEKSKTIKQIEEKEL